MPSNPSVGERAAISGYSAQYLIAADLVYEQIRGGLLEWVQLVDPEAGRVDDVILATPGWIDAYQIKWAQAKSTYTFAKFTTTRGEQSSLWRQLSDGWMSVTSAHPDRRARVGFVTNEIASANDSLPQSDGLAITFQELWLEALVPLSRNALTLRTLPRKYAAAIARLQNLTGLKSERFETFVANCRLLFDRPDPRQFLKEDPRHLQELSDIEQLAAYLQKRVAAARATVRLTRAELLTALGWDARLSQRFKHFFHIDESLYRPIEPTVSQLLRAVEARRFGYIALLGGPGSGKSTALSHTLRYRTNVRLISYYAYLRNDLSTGRGEAANFWQDLYIAIRQRGVDPGGSMPRSPSEFRKGVSEQLALLAEEWRSRSVLTVILIDGLDHIDREQHPTESLIAQLPLPEQIPTGVVVCLGTQTLNLRDLAPSILAHLGKDDRTLTMARLSRADIYAMCDSSPLPIKLQTDQKELVFTRAAGYPLATMYLLGRLMGLSDPTAADSLLHSEYPFVDIDVVYESYWQGLKEAAVPELLGLLCRMRVSFDITEAVTWVPQLDARSFVRQTKHFFQEMEGNRWSFFHNSFRQYLLQKTSEDVLGVQDDQKHRDLHMRLAELSAQHPSQSPFGRENLFHRFEAGDHDSVLKLGSQEVFRSQFFALRHPDQVFDDIGLVLRAARERLDGISLVRAWLIDSELHEREWCLGNSSFRSSIDAFLDDDALIDAIRDQNNLLVPRAQAMSVAKHLQVLGRTTAARSIFELAEPLDLLCGVEKVKLHAGDEDFLRDWLTVAVKLRQPGAIADAIGNLVADSIRPDEEGDATKNLRGDLLVDLAAMTYENDQAAWKALLEHTQVRQFLPDLLERVDWALVDNAQAPDVRTSALRRLLQITPIADLHRTDRLYLAEQMRRLDFQRQQILDVVAGIEQPEMADPSVSVSSTHGGSWSSFVDRLLFNRLYSSFGASVAPDVAVPWPTQRKLRDAARFERMLVVIANLWGSALRGQRYDEDIVLSTLRDALRVFYSTDDNSHPSSNWYYYRSTAATYFEWMILAVAAHGEAQLKALGKEFDKIWLAKEPRATWSEDLRRSIAISIFKNGGPREDLAARLDALVKDAVPADDLQSRIDALIESARAWQLAGVPDRAAALLEPTLRMSFGIYHQALQELVWVN